MTKARITSKGQLTIPKPVRDRLGLKPGDELEFIEDGGAFRINKCVGPSPFRKWRGFLKELAGQDPDELLEEVRGR